MDDLRKISSRDLEQINLAEVIGKRGVNESCNKQERTSAMKTN